MSKADPARSNPLGPIVEPGLLVLFVGINPSLRSAEVGHHFARPGNRFWPALFAAGYTPRLLRPDDDAELPRYGVGVTNIAFRPTRAASELSRAELRAGAAALAATVAANAPRLVAVLGLGAYREAFERPGATWGLQEERLGRRPVWVLPNPSGLDAHYKPADFGRVYGEALAYARAVEQEHAARLEAAAIERAHDDLARDEQARELAAEEQR